MSDKNTNPVVESLSKLAIVRKALAFLNLGEAGKVESFYQKVIKVLTKEKKILNQNLEQLKSNYELSKEALEEDLQDAIDAFDAAKIAVDVTKINNNAEQTAYVEVFLDAIDVKALAIQSIEKEIKSAEEKYEEKKKDFEDQIASLDKRLSFFSAETE